MTLRGACPSLAAPMATGDGLLLRLPPGWWPPATVSRVADAALRFGNGVVEITARGSVQLRGLRGDTVAPCIAALGLGDGPPVLVGALAGRDATELDDARPIAAQIVAGWPEGLAPKTSVVVDGGGALHLDAVEADLRLRALGGGNWALGLSGGRWIRDCASDDAAELVLDWLRKLGARRARDIVVQGIAAPPARPPAEPIGQPAPGVLGVAAPFGSWRAEALSTYVAAMTEEVLLRPAPGRALLVIGGDTEGLRARAASLGLVTDQADPRLRIIACPGAPACASAEAETRNLAARLAGLSSEKIHVSGCAKGCAHPASAAITLVGQRGGFGLVRGGTARGLPERWFEAHEIADTLLA